MTAGPFWINFGYDNILEYFSTYKAGEGPYYDTDNSGTDLYDGELTSAHHYEEYGWTITHWVDAYFNFGIGTVPSNADVWTFEIHANIDTFSISPYRQILWFTRPLAGFIDNGIFDMEAWVGGSYDVSFGSAYMSYCEIAYTGHADLWPNIFSGANTWWMPTPAWTTSFAGYGVFMPAAYSSEANHENCWDDSTYRANVADYLPANIADKAGLVKLYSQRLF
jgi:hypothetical protein